MANTSRTGLRIAIGLWSVCVCAAAFAGEQIAWRNDPNLTGQQNLIRRIGCTDAQNVMCKEQTKECYERCAKDNDINQRGFCLKLCANGAIRCFQSCGR